MRNFSNRFIFSLVLFVAAQSSIFAQSDSSSSKKSHFRAASNYLSNQVYSGRKDSLAVPYLKTSISYLHKSGVYVSAGVSALLSSSNPVRVDAVWLDAGYDFNIGEKVNAGFNVTKTFYSDASFAITSEIKAEGGAYAGYDAGVVSVNASAYIMYSQTADISTSFGLSHSFTFGSDNTQWSVEPDASVGMGTQNFYEAYVENRKSSTSNSGKGHSKKKVTNSGSGPTTQAVSFNQKNSFKILDYELSIPLKYEGKGWKAYAKPVYAIPVNPATYTVDNKLQKEAISPTFFFEIGASIDF